jgi:hypothetical protein
LYHFEEGSKLKNLKFLLCAALIGLSGAASADTMYHPYQYTDNYGVAHVGCGATWWVESYGMYWDQGWIQDNQSVSMQTGNGSFSMYCSNGTITYFPNNYNGSLWAM